MKKLSAAILSLIWILLAAMACAEAPENDMKTLVSGDWTYQVLADDTIRILSYSGTSRKLEIPVELDSNKVSAIGEEAFLSNEKLRELVVPEGIRVIEQDAFYGCERLESVSIAGSVKTIGDRAFSFCERLSDVELKEGILNIGVQAFSFCKELFSIRFPDSVEIISDDAFYNCEILYTVELGTGLKELGNGAFSHCDIHTIYLPDSIEKIGDNPFDWCKKLSSIYVSPNHRYLAVMDNVLYSKPDKRLVCYPLNFKSSRLSVPNGIRIIGASSFQTLDNYLTVTLPDSVTSIESDAFALSNVKINIPSKVDYMGANPFRGMYLDYVEIAPGNKAFRKIDNLYCDVIYDQINKRIVSGSLTKYPSDAKIIGARLFYGSNITRHEIPDGIEEIGNEAFYLCYSLKELIIPDSVKSIGKDAFTLCWDLTCVVQRGSYAEEYCEANGVRYTYPDNSDWLNQ